MSRKCFFFIAVLFCGFGDSGLRAQGYLQSPEWNEVGSLGDWAPANAVANYTAIFFFDPVHGVAATSEPKIHYIFDPSQGLWRTATVPSGFSTVRQIRFIQGKLYAATDGPDILMSSDSGKTWNYSGLNLANTNDVYADASGNIRALTDPMKSFARVDTMHCVAVGGGSLFVSSDGGDNWVTSVTGIDTASIGAFGDPCERVFICPSTYGTAALRSTDLGQTWQDVLTGAGPYSECVGGASTVCYLTDTGGMFRSIDDGVTWTSIITVNAGPHYPFFVWGPMGEHVVMPWFFVPGIVAVNEPWMTTTGGDDNLHSAVAMTDSNGAPLDQEDSMVPFRVVSTCNTFSIPIALEADVPGLSIKATLTNNSGGDVTLISSDSIYFSTPVLNQHYVQDTMWLAYDPHHLVDTAVITFENGWNCSKWSETRTVIITSIPTAAIVPPPVFAGNCHPVSEAAYVTLDSCSTLVIDSVVIPPDILSRFSLTKSLPDTLHLGTNDSLFFTFNPLDTVATILDSVQIFGYFYPSGGLDSTLNYFNFNVAWTGMDSDFSYFEQTIPVKFIALPSGIALFSEDSVIALQRASYCEHLLDTSISFTNNGCGPDTILQVTIAGSGYSVNSGSLPIILPADSTVTFPLNFYAPDTGIFQGTLSVNAVSNGMKTFSIPLTGIGFPHAGSLAANSDSLDAGQTYICQEVDTFVVVQDTGCDTVHITGVSSSSPDFTVLGGGGSFTIAPGEYDTIWINTQVDTAGGVPSNNATLSIASDAQPAFPPITLSREIQYPVQWSLHLSPPDSALAGTDIAYQIIQTGTLPPDVTTLDFTLVYNADLLNFFQVDESSVDTVGYVRTADGLAHLTFQAEPVGSNPVIATVHFTPYVAASTQTGIDLENISFVSTLDRSGDCIASVSTDSGAFTLSQSCGTQELSAFLRSGTVLIDNIEPNPASGTIVVGVSSGAPGAAAELSIIDALGRTVCQQHVVLAGGGENAVPVNIGNLPSGVYAAQLRGAGLVSTREFVKE